MLLRIGVYLLCLSSIASANVWQNNVQQLPALNTNRVIVTTLAPLSIPNKAPPVLGAGHDKVLPAVHHNVQPTILPTVIPTVAPTVATLLVTVSPNKPLPVHHVAVTEAPVLSGGLNSVPHKLGDYMKPICDALDKLSPKQLFRVQSQLKSFVQLSAGKLATCFLENYALDPVLKPVEKADIRNICESRFPPALSKVNTFKSFLQCSDNNWDEALGKELDRILAIRLNNIKKHSHHNQTTSGLNHTNHHLTLLHDDEDASAGVSLVNDVVSKVLDNTKQNKTVVKIIDATHLATTLKPQLTPIALDVKVVNSTSTLPPSVSKSLNVTIVSPTTVSPKNSSISSTHPPSSTPQPVLNLTVSENHGHVQIKAAINGTTVKPDVSLSVNLTSTTLSPTTIKPSVENKTASTTPKATTLKPTSAAKNSTIPSTSAAPTFKPLETLEQVLERQEKEKRELEVKMRLEREKLIKELHRRQDEIDARNAIRALQSQRHATATSGHVSESKLHQLEHERQMAIDPIGHTIKHQRYEASKHRAAAGGK